MADLKQEYTDVRNRTHAVEHIIVPAEDKREQIVEELICALTKMSKKTSA